MKLPAKGLNAQKLSITSPASPRSASPRLSLFSLAAFTFIIGCLVYLFAREQSYFFLPNHAVSLVPPKLTASLPSFLFSVATTAVYVCLFSTERLPVRWRWQILYVLAVNLFFEFAQGLSWINRLIYSESLGPVPIVASFDWNDIAAIVLGSIVSFSFIRRCEK